MTQFLTEPDRLRSKLRRQFDRLRDRSRDSSRESTVKISPRTSQNTQFGPSLTISPSHESPCETCSSDPLPLSLTSNASRGPNAKNNDAQVQFRQKPSHTESNEQHPTTDRTTIDMTSFVTNSSDIWSAAYREAVESLRDDIDIAILDGKSIAHLFTELDQLEREVTQESAFDRGLRYLRSLQVPLERFKLLLDLATPLANIEPTATTVVGVLRGVTAIAISFATADLDFAKQIAEMLEKISYIDDCDTLGQRTDRKDIHKALVMVYQKIIEFYKVAYEMLSRKGAKLIIKMVLETDRLPSIVQDFLRHSDTLRSLIQKATWEIVEDIKAMLYDHEIARWLGSGQMSHQTQYHDHLRTIRADPACEHLLGKSILTSWYNTTDSQQLVIIGDMGCGKTVAMSYLVDMLSNRNQRRLPEPKLCYYYCRDDKTGRATSIFSALILSLLEQLPGLKRPFFEWYKQTQASGTFDPAASMNELGQFLERLLQMIDRPVFLVIDGLDECDRASRGRILRILETLSRKTQGLKTLLSTRPEQEILEQLREVSKIELDSDTERDAIVAKKMIESQLPYLSTDVRTLVLERLTHLAQGSAIWTKMIVELIEVRRIQAIGPMRRFLESIPLPKHLYDLYAMLFSRCTSNDLENQELASTALKLLAVTRRPFSILELAWAATLGVAHVTTVDALAGLVDHQRIMSLIHPFITRVDLNDVKRRQVRLVHQSVKEFIMETCTSGLPFTQGGPVSRPCQLTVKDRTEPLNAFIFDICIRYLLLDDIGNRNLFSEEQMGIAVLPQSDNLFEDDEEPVQYDPHCTWESWEENMIRYDPTERGFGEFFVYASCHWLEYFGTITVDRLPSLESIENLCQARSARLSNWIQQNCRPDCAILSRFEFESSLYDPLGITSLYGSEAMLRHLLENSNFANGKFLRDPAMAAADQILRWGDISRLGLLFFDDRLGHQLQNPDFFRLVIRRWPDRATSQQDWDTVFNLINYMPEDQDREEWRNQLLNAATNTPYTPVL